MYDKKYDEAKKEIRSLLLTFQAGVRLEEFLKTYRNLLGERLPSRPCGFSSDIVFLQSMPDVVEVSTDDHGGIHLTGIADTASRHIQKLVSKQRKARNANVKSNQMRQPHRLPTTYNVRKITPFLPGPLRAEILQLMASYENGVTLPGLAIAYRKKFNKHLPLTKGLDTLEEMVKLIQDLELRTEGDSKKIYPRGSLASNGNEVDEAVRNKNTLKENFLNVHESGIPEDVLQDFQLLLQKCSDGILSIHFPVLYENLTGKEFDLHALGYISLADLIDALPHIFQRTTDPANARQWIILPANASVKNILKAENSAVSSHKKLSPHSQERIPADASPPKLQFFPSNFPEDLNLNGYVPVYISAVDDPGLFWFQLQAVEAVTKFQELVKDMKNFYNFVAGNEYKMKDSDIAVGVTCVIQCPDDDDWYRAVIKSIPSVDLVNIYFLDYGKRQNVPRKNVYYVRSKYHDFPACAFQAQLANLKPPNNESLWNNQAQRRFIQLINVPIIMARIMPTDKETHPVYLCDTNGETDIHVHDTLINEGFAEIYLQNQPSVNNNNLPYEADVLCKDKARVYSDSDPSSSSEEYSTEPNTSTARKLSFSPEKLSDDKPNCCNFESQKTKRYVKTVELWENRMMHVLNIENKLYLSCGELCRHLWSGRTSNFLIQMLLCRGIEIPFLKLKEEDNAELFKQCRWSKIPDMEELDLNCSNLILCPLEKALNVLIIFGYQYVALKLVIENEMENFNPCDPIWEKFDFDEEDFLPELNKLCSYDLKAKYEALKVKRLKLLRFDPANTVEECKSIEKLLSVIKRRIKHIEEISTQ